LVTFVSTWCCHTKLAPNKPQVELGHVDDDDEEEDGFASAMVNPATEMPNISATEYKSKR
jgi:hypothetical protein